MAGKRKADDEKSTNKHTKRVEKRRNDMSEPERKIDNAKRADTAATAYAVKKLRGTQQFKDLNPTEQEERVKAKRDEVRIKRVRDGIHASIVEQNLGIGEGGGAYALWDDGNMAWETEEEVDEVTQEAMWREDEKANGYRKVDLENAQLKVEGQADATTKKFEGLGFSIWRRKWRAAYKSTLRLMKKVNTDPDFISNLPPAIDTETG
ncbi:hypothetical protein GMDG_08614 [Pseudogymnoascus destructans 20631-21]|uniref:Uncharacterized protein n=1 Tax=Pseudogymnoascus destructans (strain ATCC MYA-4855 / 20631-21) TaxID=658429 RepID=L8G5R8_PSED2|nr:hypothetical protein GMDG_08614 [Pseudogymnoascus destructans 20631-21]